MDDIVHCGFKFIQWAEGIDTQRAKEVSNVTKLFCAIRLCTDEIIRISRTGKHAAQDIHHQRQTIAFMPAKKFTRTTKR